MPWSKPAIRRLEEYYQRQKELQSHPTLESLDSMATSRDLPSFYELLWNTVMLSRDPEHAMQVDLAAKQALIHRERYEKVEAKTKVPWQLVAAINKRETNCVFTRCLHNGNPLDHVTTCTPQGRGPFPNWEASAVDALTLKKFDQVSSWTVPKMLEMAEKYNGQGYLFYHPNVRSPYLWNMTNHYHSGKYAEDGKFDPAMIDKQVGVAALLVKLQLDGHLAGL